MLTVRWRRESGKRDGTAKTVLNTLESFVG